MVISLAELESQNCQSFARRCAFPVPDIQLQQNRATFFYEHVERKRKKNTLAIIQTYLLYIQD